MNTDFLLPLSETSSLALLDQERVKMAEMGQALRHNFQALMDQHTRGWFEPEHGLEESRQVLSTLTAEIQNLLQISNDLISLQRWLTSGFAPIAPTPVREVDLGQSAAAISLDDTGDLTEWEAVQNDPDSGLPGGRPLNPPILGFDMSGSVELLARAQAEGSHRRDAQPNVGFEPNPPQAWETSTLVPPKLGGLGGQAPSNPQRIAESTFTEQSTPRLASSDIHPSVVQPSQHSEQSATNVKQGITRDISQPDGLAGSPLFQKQPRSIGKLRDLAQLLAAEQQQEEAIEAVENSQDSIRAAINPIPTNLPPSILPDDLSVDHGSTELQALVKLAESENLQLPNDVSGDDTRDLAECEFVQNDSDLGLPRGCPLNPQILGFDVSAQPNVDFESNPPQAWEISTLVPPKLGEPRGQVPSKPQRIGESTLQPDGLAGSPLFQKQPRSIGGLRDLAQLLAAEQQQEEAIEAVENSQDSIRAAINPIPTNLPPSILPDDLSVDHGSTELQALVKLAESENLQLPNDVSGLEQSTSQAYQYPSHITALVDTNEMSLETSRLNNHLELGNVNQSLQHQPLRRSHREIPKILSIREQNSWVEEPACLSRTLSEEDLDVIVDAIAKEIQQQYRQFYGS